MKVVDASILIDFLLGAPRVAHLAPLFDDDLYAPDLLVPELLRQLRRFVTHGIVEDAVAEELLDRALDAPIEFLPVGSYAKRMWGWRHNIAPFDACYVALALDLECPLMTSDRRLAAAASGLVAVISA